MNKSKIIVDGSGLLGGDNRGSDQNHHAPAKHGETVCDRTDSPHSLALTKFLFIKFTSLLRAHRFNFERTQPEFPYKLLLSHLCDCKT